MKRAPFPRNSLEDHGWLNHGSTIHITLKFRIVLSQGVHLSTILLHQVASHHFTAPCHTVQRIFSQKDSIFSAATSVVPSDNCHSKNCQTLRVQGCALRILREYFHDYLVQGEFSVDVSERVSTWYFENVLKFQLRSFSSITLISTSLKSEKHGPLQAHLLLTHVFEAHTSLLSAPEGVLQRAPIG